MGARDHWSVLALQPRPPSGTKSCQRAGCRAVRRFRFDGILHYRTAYWGRKCLGGGSNTSLESLSYKGACAAVPVGMCDALRRSCVQLPSRCSRPVSMRRVGPAVTVFPRRSGLCSPVVICDTHEICQPDPAQHSSVALLLVLYLLLSFKSTVLLLVIVAVSPFIDSAAVPFWGQTTQILRCLSPGRDCSP